MSHVFTTRVSPTETPAPRSRHTLLDDEVQDALLEHLPARDHAKMKSVLRHFAKETIPTFSSVPGTNTAWREALPPLVAENKYVLNGILSIGSLHLSTLTNVMSEQEDYQDLAANQMNIGMAEYRDEVQQVTADKSEALFAFSTTISLFVLSTTDVECRTALKSLMEARVSDERRREIISNLLQCICRIFRTLRGVLVILVPCYHHICAGTFGPVLQRDWWPPTIPVTAEELEHDKRLRDLEKMWSNPGKTYEYSFDCLRRALKSLRETSALVSRLTTIGCPGDIPGTQTFDSSSILHWITELPLEFLTLLEQRQMEAWVLMAYYALLPAKVVTNSFWIGDMATNIFETSALIVGEENWDWIAWPATVLGIDLERLQSTTTSA